MNRPTNARTGEWACYGVAHRQSWVSAGTSSRMESGQISSGLINVA